MTELELRIRHYAAEAINLFMDKVAAESLPEVPIEDGELRASEVYPGNDVDGSHSAEALDLDAMVSYNTVYAAAQHEGYAQQVRLHPVRPITEGGHITGFFTDTSVMDPHLIEWKVEHHTEPGTKTHFLSDPFKRMIPEIEPFVAAYIRAKLEGKL